MRFSVLQHRPRPLKFKLDLIYSNDSKNSLLSSRLSFHHVSCHKKVSFHFQFLKILKDTLSRSIHQTPDNVPRAQQGPNIVNNTPHQTPQTNTMQFGYEQYPTQQVAPQAQPQAQPQMLQTKILVLNATGKHGIGACRGLRDAGYTAVFGSSRSKESKTLSALGVTTVQVRRLMGQV